MRRHERASSLLLPPHVSTSAPSSRPAPSPAHKRFYAATSLPPPHPPTPRIIVLPVRSSRKSTVTSTVKRPVPLKNHPASCLRVLLVRQKPLLPSIHPPPSETLTSHDIYPAPPSSRAAAPPPAPRRHRRRPLPRHATATPRPSLVLPSQRRSTLRPPVSHACRVFVRHELFPLYVFVTLCSGTLKDGPNPSRHLACSKVFSPGTVAAASGKSRASLSKTGTG